MQGGKSGELVGRLKQALAEQGARVLDATGTGAPDKRRFLSALEAEKNRTHAASAFDVMVGIQRVLEGTDWPVCSAVYCVGMPGSLNTVVQFLGRAMRLKADDYPAVHRDRARLVFFVPCGGGTALADLSIDHSRHALLTWRRAAFAPSATGSADSSEYYSVNVLVPRIKRLPCEAWTRFGQDFHLLGE